VFGFAGSGFHFFRAIRKGGNGLPILRALSVTAPILRFNAAAARAGLAPPSIKLANF
jgi:hypothetical protein